MSRGDRRPLLRCARAALPRRDVRWRRRLRGPRACRLPGAGGRRDAPRLDRGWPHVLRDTRFSSRCTRGRTISRGTPCPGIGACSTTSTSCPAASSPGPQRRSRGRSSTSPFASLPGLLVAAIASPFAWRSSGSSTSTISSGQSPVAADGASCTFFLGRKAPLREPIVRSSSEYRGVKRAATRMSPGERFADAQSSAACPAPHDDVQRFVRFRGERTPHHEHAPARPLRGVPRRSAGPEHGAAVVAGRDTPAGAPPRPHRSGPGRSARALRRDLPALQTWRFDVVHTHNSKDGILGRWAAYFAGVPVVVHTIHNVPFRASQHAAGKSLLCMLERLTARITDAFLAVSTENVRGYLAHSIGRRDPIPCRVQRSRVSSGMTRLPAPAEARALLGLPDASPFVGWFGRFSHQKDPFTFVRAARAVTTGSRRCASSCAVTIRSVRTWHRPFTTSLASSASPTASTSWGFGPTCLWCSAQWIS